MMRELVELVQRLNLSDHQNLVGAHFPEIVALLSIVFGGSFLLFGWKHHAYFLGVAGFLVGGWAGLLLKGHLSPGGGGVAPVLYLAVCAVAGAFVAACWKRFVGILLGGFTVAIVGSVFFPRYFKPGDHTLPAICVAFLLGGGLGAIFPRFFFIFNSSLIGSVFVTYGVSTAVVGRVMSDIKPGTQALIHLCVFLPLLLFGVLYQLTTSHEAAVTEEPAAARRPARAPA
jgi:hypothetical protein